MIPARTLLIITLAGSVLAGQAMAISPEIQRKSEGWWWYKDPKEKPPKPKEETPPPPPPAPAPEAPKAIETPKLMSVEWLRKNLEVLREKAIDDPTDDNVKNYLYAQRVMMDKAEQFSRKAIDVAQNDPLLDERNRFPVSNYAMSYLQRSAHKAREKALKELAAKGGIWFFYDTSCRFCMIQMAAVDGIKKAHGFSVLNISMDGKGLAGMDKYVRDKGHFKEFGLTLVPSVVFAVPPRKFMVLSQGALAGEDLEKRLLAYAKTEGLISKDLEKEIFLMDRGLLTTEDMKDLEAKGVNPEDPSSWVKYLREQLGRRY